MTGKENILKFVQTDEISDDDGGLFQNAFDKAKSSGLTVKMVSRSELLQEDLENDKSVFVMDVFSGECFESLVAQKKRVFGSLCILRCVEKIIPLPNVYHPVYSLAMSGVIISCTSIVKPLRDKLYQLVERMGGTPAKAFTSAVTHLVAGEVGSKKYTIACNLKKLVVLPSWVEESWKATQKQDFDATDSDFVASHLCPIFKGCSVCVTGIGQKKRKNIQSTVENHGGHYSAELKLKSTTHLLVERPVGEKYDFALRWNVSCVHPNWLYDCIEAGHWLDESKYSVKEERDLDKTCSTGGRLSLAITTIDATMNSTSLDASRKAAEAARRSAETRGRKDILHKSTSDAGAIRRNTITKHDENEDDFDYNVTMPSGSMFLDGCKIYLTGFPGKKLEFLQKIVNAGGATRFNQLNSSVSHVVMGTKVAKDVEMLTKSEFTPHVVTAKWLLDCCRQEQSLPETDYYCMETDDVFGDVTQPSTRGSAQTGEIQTTLGKENVADVLSQYLKYMEDDMADAVEDKNAVFAKDQNSEKEIDGAETEADDVDVSCGDGGNSIDDKDSGSILRGLMICVKGFSEDQRMKMKEVIESNGGGVLEETSTNIADFAILPMNYMCDCKANIMVTFCWLERSLECGEPLEPSSNFLFTPFSLVKGVFPLKDSVISISQYAGVEREHLMQLAEMLGAHCQEFFSRKIRANLLANTQLLLQEPTGPKYDAAVHWNIPAITADWLFECARTGTKVPEGPYRLEKEQPPKQKEVEKDVVCPVDKNASTSQQFGIPEKTGNNNELQGQMKTKEAVAPLDNQKAKYTDKESSKSIPTVTHPTINKPPPCFGPPKRPSFDLTDALEFLKSPVCSSDSSTAHSRLSRGSRGSFSLEDYLHEHMQVALKNSGKHLVPHKVDNDTIITKANQPAEEKKELGENKFLHGVVLVVSKKLSKLQTDIHNMASAIGADCRWNLDDLCTHVIHEGRLTREYNQVKCKGVFVVSPHWLYTCVDEQCRVDETLYPPSYNPKLTLSVVKTRKSGSKDVKGAQHKDDAVETGYKKLTKETCVESKGSESKQVTTEISDHDVTKNLVADHERIPDVEAKVFSQDSAQNDSLQTKEEIRQIKGIVQALSTRRRSRRLNSSNSGQNSRNSSGNSTGESSRKLTRRPSSRLRSLRSGQNSSEDEADEQPVETITYDDPKSRIERERIIAQLNCSPNPTTNSECSEDDDDNTTDEKQERSKSDNSTTEDAVEPLPSVKSEAPSPSHTSTPTAPPIALQIATAQRKPEPISLLNPMVVQQKRVQPNKTHKFLLSSMSQQEKIDYGALIEELGGKVFDNQYFSPECRHIIVGQLGRNEKCLASIAAGNWVLHKSFLEASRTAGHFVDEEVHEWGVKVPGEPLSSLAIAARRWRMKLEKLSRRESSNTKYGAFHNWKVLLFVETNKLASFTRLLEAGGAKVVGTTLSESTNNATHALISPGTSAPAIEGVDFERIEQSGVLVLRTEYIADFLIIDPPPTSDKYLFWKPQEPLKSRKRKPEEEFSETIGEKRSRKLE